MEAFRGSVPKFFCAQILLCLEKFVLSIDRLIHPADIWFYRYISISQNGQFYESTSVGIDKTLLFLTHADNLFKKAQ